MNAFICSGCNRVCEWETRVPLPDDHDVAIKTIGNRYCHALDCISIEAQVHGASIGAYGLSVGFIMQRMHDMPTVDEGERWRERQLAVIQDEYGVVVISVPTGGWRPV